MLFPWYIKYPNQNDEILNLDWILSTIDNLVNEVANFVTLNTIKYADPIQWNITTQYEKNTVVIDPISGSAYISTKPVPAGVGLNNTDYWNIIFTLDVISANKNITLRDDANNMLATFESNVDDWLLWQGTLYIVTRNISIGQAYVVDYNISRYTVERFLKDYISNLKTYVDNVVGALRNHVDTLAGALTDLNTTDKTNLVAAINEVLAALTTYATNTDNKIGVLSNLSTTDKSNLVAAINEVLAALTSYATNVDSRTGSLSDLSTTDKSNLVAAINEVLAALTNAVTHLSSRFQTDTLKRVQAKNILFVGDSYGDEAGEWPAIVKNNLGLTDDNCHIECVGGAGFVSNGVLLFKNQIENYQGNKAAITDIIICGGLNDSFSSTISDNWWNTLRTNMTDFANYAKTNYPNADIHLGYIGNGNDFASGSLISGRTYECRQMCKYFYNEIAAGLGWQVIPNVEFALAVNSGNIGSDGVHPSNAGSYALGYAISEYIAGGNVEVKYPKYSPIAAGSYTGDYQLYYEVNNGRGHLHTDQWYMNISGATTLSGSFKLATLGPLQFNKGLSVHVVLQLHNFDNLTDVYVPARLLFARDELYVQLLDGNSHSSNTGGGTIHVNDFDIDFPIEYCV